MSDKRDLNNLQAAEKELSEVKRIRRELGIRILKEMEKNGEFPISNKYQLSKTMMDYFRKMNLKYDLQDGSKWLPDRDYWIYILKELRQMLNDEGLCLEFLYTEGEPGFTGNWQFCTEEEYINKLIRIRDEISTRIDTFNDKKNGGDISWKVDVPGIAPLKRLA